MEIASALFDSTLLHDDFPSKNALIDSFELIVQKTVVAEKISELLTALFRKENDSLEGIQPLYWVEMAVAKSIFTAC